MKVGNDQYASLLGLHTLNAETPKELPDDPSIDSEDREWDSEGKWIGPWVIPLHPACL
jgi:hypothetical protein